MSRQRINSGVEFNRNTFYSFFQIQNLNGLQMNLWAWLASTLWLFSLKRNGELKSKNRCYEIKRTRCLLRNKIPLQAITLFSDFLQAATWPFPTPRIPLSAVECVTALETNDNARALIGYLSVQAISIKQHAANVRCLEAFKLFYRELCHAVGGDSVVFLPPLLCWISLDCTGCGWIIGYEKT